MANSVRSARCPEAGAAGVGLYRPRSPRASPLWQCAKRHAGELRASGHASNRPRRAVEQQVIERFIACGDPHEGFARIYCDTCRHEFLLAYSCKTRYFCPSCHQKRVILYGEWVEQNVLAPVAHRQYVFTLPKLLRPIFSRHRAWLGELCRIPQGLPSVVAALLLTNAYAATAPGAHPGLVLFVQTFGDLANFNPHLHVLAADGVFGAEGFRRAVLAFLVKAGAITHELGVKMLGWRYCGGFSAHNRVRVGDREGRMKLAGYMIRAPMSLAKMTYDRASGTVIYRSKLHPGLKRNFQVMPAAQWLELLCKHIPDRYEHLVRYVGSYANRAKASWARLIGKVYKADPLVCPKCNGPSRGAIDSCDSGGV